MIPDDPSTEGTAQQPTPPIPTTEEAPMTVTVYTKPQCVQCDATKRTLASNRIEYETVDLTKDPAALAKVKELGYAQAPVVVTSEDHWSGFRPDKIKALATGRSASRGGQIGLDPAAPRGRIAL